MRHRAEDDRRRLSVYLPIPESSASSAGIVPVSPEVDKFRLAAPKQRGNIGM